MSSPFSSDARPQCNAAPCPARCSGAPTWPAAMELPPIRGASGAVRRRPWPLRRRSISPHRRHFRPPTTTAIPMLHCRTAAYRIAANASSRSMPHPPPSTEPWVAWWVVMAVGLWAHRPIIPAVVTRRSTREFTHVNSDWARRVCCRSTTHAVGTIWTGWCSAITEIHGAASTWIWDLGAWVRLTTNTFAPIANRNLIVI